MYNVLYKTGIILMQIITVSMHKMMYKWMAHPVQARL
jgi:hypothetical protein